MVDIYSTVAIAILNVAPPPEHCRKIVMLLLEFGCIFEAKDQITFLACWGIPGSPHDYRARKRGSSKTGFLSAVKMPEFPDDKVDAIENNKLEPF